MTSIIDTNHDVTDRLEALGNLGIKTVIRYLSAINPGGEKSIKPPEARAIAAAGIRLGLVCEGWGDFAHGGISAVAGQRDAAFCVRQAPAVDHRLAGLGEDGLPRAWRQDAVLAMAVRAIQQLKADNDNLRAEIRRAR